MIRENQQLLNQLNVISDGLIVFVSLPLAFWLYFYVLPWGVISVPFSEYIVLSGCLMLVHLFTYAAFGLYHSFRRIPLTDELSRLLGASLLDMVFLLSFLFIQHEVHYSRGTLALFFLLSVSALACKRVFLRRLLRYYRQRGYNQKHVVILGSGQMAREYHKAILAERELGYTPIGYVADRELAEPWIPYLGGFSDLETVLERSRPDEVVSAIDMADYPRTPQIIAACEKAGTKLSIIPFYAEYMPTTPQFDDIGGIPLMNIRRIPLDNLANAFCKRAMDILGSLTLLLLTSPVMLVCAAGVRLSSPGPVIFRQERVGRDKKPFYMYKFRSMRVNAAQDTGWSTNADSRKTPFGSFLRKFSLDEFPQFFNVLKGDMSLVGPRPELPYFVEQFKEDIPLYMVKHQVRPGITGWAQVHDLRGDTSIEERIEHDIYYIEHWSLLLDIKILLMTVFKGKFVNQEKLH